MFSILLVGSDFDFIEAMRLFLEKNEYGVTVTISGEECLEIMKGRSFNVVLIEDDLPGMSGLETIEEIKSRYQNVEIMMVSSKRDVNIAVSAIKRGAREFHIKPIDFDDFLNGLKYVQKEIESRFLKEAG